MADSKVRFRHCGDGRWRWGDRVYSDDGLMLGFRDNGGTFYSSSVCEELNDIDLCGFRDSVFLGAIGGLSSDGSLRAGEIVNKANSIADAAIRDILGE